MKELIISFDNGISGACCILNLFHDEEVYYFEMPTFKVSSSFKGVGYITRIDHKQLYRNLEKYIKNRECYVYLERAMKNPGRFKNSISAVRAFEATIITLENLDLEYKEIDSRKWQHTTLGKEVKGRDNLKIASLHKAQELFPSFYKDIQKHKDGDSFLIAYYIKQKILNNEKEFI